MLFGNSCNSDVVEGLVPGMLGTSCSMNVLKASISSNKLRRPTGNGVNGEKTGLGEKRRLCGK